MMKKGDRGWGGMRRELWRKECGGDGGGGGGGGGGENVGTDKIAYFND